jgi:Glycosyltransferase sugar-binding region containing DXD motif
MSLTTVIELRKTWKNFSAMKWFTLLLCCQALKSAEHGKGGGGTAHNSSLSSHPSFHSSSSSLLLYPQFPEALSPRIKDRPVRNKFEVTDSCPSCHADLHTVIYYRSESTCEVKIRRLDEIGWDFNITISLQDIPLNNAGPYVLELHKILPSPNSSFISILLQTRIKLEALPESQLESYQKIPRIIMQTYYTTNATNIFHWNAFMTFVELNPEYELLLMLDKHCRIFIRKHFTPDVLKAYDGLVPKAFKADLFRYCFLYIKGGCYFDNKMINRLPLRNAILPNDDFLVCSDSLPYGKAAKTLKETKRYYNAVICSAPRDQRMLKAIRFVVEMVIGQSYGLSDLGISGPVAFYEATKAQSKETNVRFSHELGRHPYISKSFPLGHASLNNGAREYRDYFVNEKVNNNILLTKFFNGYYSSAYRRYGDLWKQGKVFYEPITLSWRSYRLFIEPGILPYYTVAIDHADGHITVELRTFWNTYPVAVIGEEFKSFVRKSILLAGMGGLTDKIELKLLDTVSSAEHYIGLEVPSRARPRTVYSIREHLGIGI